jgi:hypothetical protein
MALSSEVEKSLFALPLEERARLADRLLSSLETAPSSEWLADVDSEISDRMAARKRGQIKTSSGGEAMARIWKRLDK